MPADAWSRLADYVVARRIELGYERQVDLAHVSALGMRTLGSIETGGRTRYNRSTLAALEQALEWQSGSVRAILDGGEPTPADPDQTETVPKIRTLDFEDELEEWFWELMHKAGMTDTAKRRVIRHARIDWRDDEPSNTDRPDDDA